MLGSEEDAKNIHIFKKKKKNLKEFNNPAGKKKTSIHKIISNNKHQLKGTKVLGHRLTEKATLKSLKN